MDDQDQRLGLPTHPNLTRLLRLRRSSEDPMTVAQLMDAAMDKVAVSISVTGIEAGVVIYSFSGIIVPKLDDITKGLSIPGLRMGIRIQDIVKDMTIKAAMVINMDEDPNANLRQSQKAYVAFYPAA